MSRRVEWTHSCPSIIRNEAELRLCPAVYGRLNRMAKAAEVVLKSRAFRFCRSCFKLVSLRLKGKKNLKRFGETGKTQDWARKEQR